VATLTASTDNSYGKRPHPDGVAVMSEPAASRLIVALDFPSRSEALALVDRLDGAVRWLKVGLELFLAEGRPLVEEIQRRGYSVFLDLKLHDIPNTVASAVRVASQLGVGMLTVHAAGGQEMLAAAVEAAATTGPLVLAVTVLTSMDDAQLEGTGVGRGAGPQVTLLASLAKESGILGLVCSPNEVAGLRDELGGEMLLVTPGIRPRGSDAADQKRTATPGAAITDGASYLVVGRPITRAADPLAAARQILSEMA
jgi:orotidine-5'-phosphate decarboxylase